MIRKLILITLLLLTMTPCLRGQRKEMSQARSYIKSGKDFDKAEKLMEDLLARDSSNRMNPKIYLLLYQALLKQYEAGNEKLYLSQQYDTAALFNLTKRMFEVYEALDSVDILPDSKGKVKLEYRHKNAEELNAYRPNLFYGGTFHIHKADYKTAFSFFDAYIDCANQPLFSAYDYWSNDPKMKDASYWATYCGFKLKEPALVLRYSDVALRDSSKRRTTMIYVAEAYSWLKDKQRFKAILQEGFAQYHTSPYFFTHLMDCYTEENKLDSALSVADAALASDGDNALFLFAKSSVLLNLERYDECVAISDSLIAVNDTLPEPYYNAGTAYMNKAFAIEKSHGQRGRKAVIRGLYAKALPYIEKYRELAPDKKGKWGPALYRIYLYLNKGKQFEEIDSLLNKK